MAQQYQKIVQEDLNTGTGDVWITAPSGGELRSIQVGLHSFARGQKEWTATWAPGSIAAGSKASTTVTVPDAAVADFVLASHDKMLTSDLRIAGHVSAAATAKVVIHNPTSAAVTVASGTVSVLVFPVNAQTPTPADPLCWTWQSNPGEATPTVEVAAVLVEDVPGQWDGGGTFTVTWWDNTTTVTNVDTDDVGTVLLGSKTRDYTAPTSPPPEETITVSLTGGSPEVNRSTQGVVQFQQDAGGAILTGNSDGCCQYEPFSLTYEECGGDCIFTGGGGCP